MSYCTAAEVKTYLAVAGADDDALLTALIGYAEQWIETYTDRVFECDVDTTRYFEVGKDTNGRVLTLDGDLCAITSVVTNANNGSGGTALTVATDYITVPRNTTPWYAIKLTAGTAYTWTYTYDPDGGVTVTGKWAYSETPPGDIKHACARLTAYLYKQRDAQVFDVLAVPGAGIMTLPQGMPKDLRQILDAYRARL